MYYIKRLLLFPISWKPISRSSVCVKLKGMKFKGMTLKLARLLISSCTRYTFAGMITLNKGKHKKICKEFTIDHIKFSTPERKICKSVFAIIVA